MIIIKLMGGLGNQMFQYAAAKSIERNSLVLIDLSFLQKNDKSTEDFTARKLELTVFRHIKRKTFNLNLIGQLFLNRALNNFLLNKIKPYKIVNDDNFDSYLHQNGTILLEGYFQNHKYLDPIRNELLNDFKFPPLPTYMHSLLKCIMEKTSIAIHVRRSDYLKSNINAIHGVLSKSYYLNAISYIKQRIKNPTFFIFSDDIEWCRNNISLDNVVFVNYPNNPAWTELHLISCCKHQIIANSTFSWWGAWLNENDTKIVIAPKNWFVKKKTDIIPNEWISL